MNIPRVTLGIGVAALAALSAVGIFYWDEPVAAAMRAGAGEAWRGLARFLSRYGDFPFLLVAGVIALGIALRTGRKDWARTFTAMILAGVIAGLCTNLVKLGTGRVRPRVENVEHGWYGPHHNGQWVSLRHDFQSYPSSHASCAFGFFLPLFLSRRAVGVAGLLVAAAIAWSRVQLNAHYISDVATGALVGILAGWIVWRWIVQRGGLSRWLG